MQTITSARAAMVCAPLAALCLLLALLPRGFVCQSQATPGQSPPPYAVLRTQNLVLLGTIFSVLLIVMILIAVCVYKPVRRR